MSSNRNRLEAKARRGANKGISKRRKFSLLTRGFESLETRTLMAVDSTAASTWTNPSNRLDVNGDGRVSPADALSVVEDLRHYGVRSLLASSASSSTTAKTLLTSSVDDKGLVADPPLYVDVDGDGSVKASDVMLIVNALNEDSPSMIFRLEATDLAGHPISTITQGEYFYIRGVVQDIRTDTDPDAEGVFFAYADIAYDNLLVAVASSQAIVYEPNYVLSQSGDTSTPGFIDEIGAGAFTGLDGVPGQPVQAIFNVAFRATAQGTLNFTPLFASTEVFLWGETDPLPDGQIDFQSAPLTVTAPSSLPLPNISFSGPNNGDVTVNEGALGNSTSAVFVVTVSNNNYDTRVSFSTNNGTAVQNPVTPFPQDYVATSGFLLFEQGGSLSKTITVQVNGDDFLEGDETFSVSISNPLNGTVTDPQAIGKIVDEASDVPGISIANVSQTEGDSGFINYLFVVTRNPLVGTSSTVQFATSDSTAVAGRDYTATNGTLSFAANETAKTITVQVAGDAIRENSETFSVTLSNPSNSTILNRNPSTGAIIPATGTIVDNDTSALPGLSINSRTLTEGNAGTTAMNFTVRLSAAATSEVKVRYDIVNGTASAGSDYNATPLIGTLTFAPGVLTQTVSVSIVGDTASEPTETFVVNLSNLSANAVFENTQGTGTITTDDGGPVTPTLSIAGAVGVMEGNIVGTTPQTFVVTLSPGATAPVTVTYNTIDGTATTADNDYTGVTNGVLNFAVGETSKTITVAVKGDTRNEAPESYSVTLSSPTGGAVIGSATASGTINNDDAVPNILIAPFSQNEGNSGTTVFLIPVTLSAASGQQVTATYRIDPGTAAFSSDYNGTTTGVLTFAPDVTTRTITVNVLGDTSVEPNETFNISLLSLTNATASGSPFSVTITNDDALTPTLSIANSSVFEGNSGPTSQTFIVTLSPAATAPVTVAFNTFEGTAKTTTDSDYTPTSGTLAFAIGETSKTITVLVTGDTKNEASETYTVKLSSPTGGGAVIGTGLDTATGTINNDDALPSVSISPVPFSKNEGNVNNIFAIPVTLSAVSGQQVTVVYSTTSVGGTAAAGADYTATSGTLVFEAGETSKTISVNVIGDTRNETDETFSITLTPTNATAVGSPVSITILNDDPLPVVSIDSLSKPELNNGQTQPFVFTVSLNAASGQQVSVPYNITADTATSPGDFAPVTTGTLVFTEGQLTKSITVNVSGDTTSEDNETFKVTLLNSLTNATLNPTATVGVGTIENDDAPPGLSITNASATEGNAGQADLKFVVSLGAVSGQEIKVEYETFVGGSDTATVGIDYAVTSGTLTFAPGQNSQTVTVKVTGDTLHEANETFSVRLKSPVNSSIATGFGTAVGTINNDDNISISIGNFTGDNQETTGAQKSFTFPITLIGTSQLPITVHVFTTPDTATTGASNDFVSFDQTLVFDPGQTTKTVTVLVNDDLLDEAPETFKVNLELVSPLSAQVSVGTASVTATITDNDPSPEVSIAASTPSQSEGVSNYVFNVSLNAASGQQVLVPFNTTDGGAKTSDSDYGGLSGTLTFAPGQTSKAVTVTVNNDNRDEFDETFSVDLQLPANATIASGQGSATGTILDNDAPPKLSITSISKDEGNSGTTNFVFTVSLDIASGKEVTVPFNTSDDSATAGTDYNTTSGVLTFAPNETTKSITVGVIGNLVSEANETFKVSLGTPTNADIASGQGIATGTITNDDILNVNINDVSHSESEATTTSFEFVVSLGAQSDTTIEIPFATSNDTASAGSDYTATSGALTFAPGETLKTITVAFSNDAVNELDEKFKVTLTDTPDITLIDGVGEGTILNDDALPTLSIADVSKDEGDSGTTNFEFVVTLTGASDRDVTVQYATGDLADTAKAPSDYASLSGTLTFSPGQTTKTITVAVRGDLLLENLGNSEKFSVKLSSASSTASIVDGLAIGEITNGDDDLQPSTLAGKVWVDSTNKGLAGVTIMLDGTSEGDEVIHLVTVTNAAGSYEFTVEPGNYTISEIQPGFYRDGVEQIGTAGGSSAVNDKIKIDNLQGNLTVTGYNFTEIGLRNEFLGRRGTLASSANDAGIVAGAQALANGQVTLTAFTPGTGGAWYSIDNGIDGILTVEADGTGQGATTLSLYDQNMVLITSVTGGNNGDARLDYTGVTGQPYFLRVQGTNPLASVKLTNLVKEENGRITVRGTSGDDTFTYNASTATHTYSIAGVSYTLNPAAGKEVVFNGGGGDDKATLTDSAFADTLSGTGDVLSFTNTHGLSVRLEDLDTGDIVDAITSHNNQDIDDTTAPIDYVLTLTNGTGTWLDS